MSRGSRSWPAFEIHWDSVHRPLPKRWVRSPTRRAGPGRGDLGLASPPFDICARLRHICEDVVQRCEEFRHIHMPAVLLAYTPARTRSRYGLHARTTPMRFAGGRLRRQHGNVEYQVQRYFLDGREILYIVTFCLPRFLHLSFEDKLTTIIHELFHINPAFDGDIRRLPGRYRVHSHSRQCYDAHMKQIVQAYLRTQPPGELLDWLHLGDEELCHRHPGIVGTVVPRPKLFPVTWATSPEALRRAIEEWERENATFPSAAQD